jgi:hypothetical protein
MKRLGMLIVLVSALIAVAPGSALAAVQRWASPTGSGTRCTQGSPCSIVTAITAREDFADIEVVLAGNQGPYGTPGSPISTELAPNTPYRIDIHGAAHEPRPVIYSDAGPFALLVRAGESVRDVAVYDSHGRGPTGGQAAIGLLGGSADRVIGVGNSAGCAGGPATFTNSLCRGVVGAEFRDYVPSSGGPEVTLRNDTLIGAFAGLLAVGGVRPVDVSVTNSIVHSNGLDKDVVTRGGTAPVTVVLDHSNYQTTSNNPGGVITPPGTGTNQTAAPLFVAPGRDYHEAPGSPTIGAGITNPFNGTSDLDGNPRTINGKTDIGAYQYVPPTLGIRAPALSKLKVRPSKFKLGKHHKKPKISYTESEAASVTFYIYAIRHGRLLPVGTFTRSAHAGRNSFAFSSKVNGKKLKHGRYELVADPVAFGLPGAAVNVKFRVE